MAIVTPNLGLTVPAMGDAPNIGVVSQALEDIDTYAGKVDDRTADAYSDSADYAVNDLCIHDNKLYKCSTAITGGEAWNSSHWTETSLADEIGSLNDQIATHANTITPNTGFSLVSSGVNKYFKSANVVCIDFKLAASGSNTSLVVMNLPSGYRPSSQINAIGWRNDAITSGNFGTVLVSVESNGDFKVRAMDGGVLKSYTVSGCIMYMVE